MEASNKIDQVLATQTKIKEYTQMNEIRDERWVFTTDSKEIQIVIKECLENLYYKRLENCRRYE